MTLREFKEHMTTDDSWTHRRAMPISPYLSLSGWLTWVDERGNFSSVLYSTTENGYLGRDFLGCKIWFIDDCDRVRAHVDTFYADGSQGFKKLVLRTSPMCRDDVPPNYFDRTELDHMRLENE